MENNVVPLTVDNSFGRADFQPEYEEAKKRTYTDNTSLKANGIQALEFRVWALRNGITIPSRGRIPVAIVKQYLEQQ